MPPHCASSELVRAYPPVTAGAGGADQARRVVRASLASRELHRRVNELASQRMPVLILGETGTGKTLIAASLREPGTDAELITVNCASLADTQLAQVACEQLPGAEARAPTTLLLDEIGELSPWGQAVLLRALATNEPGPGSRLVAATHRDLDGMVRAGKFSGELLMRLRGATLQLTPLRDRREEVAPLALHFLRLALSASGTPFVSLDPTVLAYLELHSWPGNVRELQNVMSSALTRSSEGLLTIESLPEPLRERGAQRL